MAFFLKGVQPGAGTGLDPMPDSPPERLYVMCSQGFNRSALFAGLLLRHLGLGHEEAVRIIQTARPGALSNQTFLRLIRERPLTNHL